MVLLVGINAKYIHTTLAVRSLQANAGKYRKDVEIAEYTINHRREEIFSGHLPQETGGGWIFLLSLEH